jgi:hypothetical protein
MDHRRRAGRGGGSHDGALSLMDQKGVASGSALVATPL